MSQAQVNIVGNALSVPWLHARGAWPASLRAAVQQVGCGEGELAQALRDDVSGNLVCQDGAEGGARQAVEVHRLLASGAQRRAQGSGGQRGRSTLAEAGAAGLRPEGRCGPLAPAGGGALQPGRRPLQLLAELGDASLAGEPQAPRGRQRSRGDQGAEEIRAGSCCPACRLPVLQGHPAGQGGAAGRRRGAVMRGAELRPRRVLVEQRHQPPLHHRLAQGVRRGEAVCGLVPQHRGAELPELLRAPGWQLRNRPCPDALCQQARVAVVERRPVCQKLVQNDAQRPDVTGWRVRDGLCCQLRSEVPDCLQVGPLGSERLGQEHGGRHPAHHHVALGGQEQAPRSKVPVAEALLVEVLQHEGCLREPLQDLRVRELTATLPGFLDAARYVPTLRVLRDDAKEAELQEALPHHHQMRMPQPRQVADLLQHFRPISGRKAAHVDGLHREEPPAGTHKHRGAEAPGVDVPHPLILLQHLSPASVRRTVHTPWGVAVDGRLGLPWAMRPRLRT
mmetsp:Transcript_57671/g.185302  ORF Transcript_57671/g.185302 Transcript_57671/m.185302 type:complete len:507 (+) Transcript_57671:27-1547(+)